MLLSPFSRLRLCDPIDGSPPGSPVPGILQARTLEWVAISFSNAGKWKVKEVAHACPTQRPHGLQPTRLLRPWDFPGKSTGVGCLCLLQAVFPTQWSNLTLFHPLYWQADSLPLHHLGSPLFWWKSFLPVSLCVCDTISRLSNKSTTWFYHVLADQHSIFIHLEICRESQIALQWFLKSLPTN